MNENLENIAMNEIKESTENRNETKVRDIISRFKKPVLEKVIILTTKKKAFTLKDTFKYLLKRFVLAMFSHVGSFFLVLVYMIMGGYLFAYIESYNEHLACITSYNQYIERLNKSVSEAVFITYMGLNESDTFSLVLDSYNSFAIDVFTLLFDPRKNCSAIGSPGGPLPKWNIPNSIFFAATLMTTIGYGQLYPVTMWGKIVCVIFSFLGIPIMLLYLTRVGNVMAILFRKMYLNLCCCRCFVRHRPDQYRLQTITNFNDYDDWDDEYQETITIPIIVVVIVVFIYMMMGSALFIVWETDWSLVDGAYFAFITMSTIGLGDMVPGENKFDQPGTMAEFIVGSGYCILGLSVISMCITLVQEELEAKIHWFALKLGLTKDNTQ